LFIKYKYIQNEDGTKVEYRVWNPFRSKLSAAILGGVDDIGMVSFSLNFLISFHFLSSYLFIYFFTL